MRGTSCTRFTSWMSFELQNDWAGHKPDTKQTETVWCFLQSHPASLHHQRCRHDEVARSGHSRLLLRNAISECSAPHQIRQLSFICAVRPVSASAKVPLPNGHTAMNNKPRASKVGFWQMLQRLPRRVSFFYSFLIEAYFLTQNCLPSSYFFSTFNLLKNKEEQPH